MGIGEKSECGFPQNGGPHYRKRYAKSHRALIHSVMVHNVVDDEEGKKG